MALLERLLLCTLLPSRCFGLVIGKCTIYVYVVSYYYQTLGVDFYTIVPLLNVAETEDSFYVSFFYSLISND